jgi:DUF3047 family protein
LNKLCLGILLLFYFNLGIASSTDQLVIGNFSNGELNGWKAKEFKGKTHYRLTKIDNVIVLRADSDSSASGLFKEQRIDLYKTPYLNWQWRIESRLNILSEQERSGDDYAARIYVLVSGGWAFWRTIAINYVWSSASKEGQLWPNAFAGKKVMMLALRSSADPLSTWKFEKRNVLEDLQQIHGEKIRYIDAIAVMTDTDNSKGKTTAFYGDIYFTRD